MIIRLAAVPAAIDAADTETRILRGIAVPYGQPGNTSAGRVTVDAGAIRLPENLRRVKLFNEHGRVTPTGYAIEADDTPEALRMGFTLARTDDGDRALLEASEGVRDALSVELDNVVVKNGHVTRADLVAVAQVAVPAFAAAQLAAELSDDDQAAVFDLATQIVERTAPDTEEEPPTEETPPEEEAAMTVSTTEAADAAPTLAMTPRPATQPVATPQLWAAAASQALRGLTDVSQINAALADITPVTAMTDGLFPRPAWIGELWTPRAVSRPLVEAIGVSPLTSMTIEGWKWVTEPVVAPYAGNKTAVPTSPAVVGPATATAQRIAGGWDLDRIYVDFPTGFLEAFQAAAVRDYAKKSQDFFINGHPAITGPPAIPAADGILADATDLGAQADLVTAVQAVVTFLTGNGAQVSFIAMASDAYRDFFAVTSADAPWWLANQGSVNLNGNSDIAGTAVVVDPSLPPGTVLGGDRDAVSLWETGPINVNAINLPNGGVDFGLFGYWAQMVHDDDGLAKATVTQVVAASASAPASKSSK
jgi:hypothetical protein